MTRSADIVIIGAGLTGLTVAAQLEKSGFFDYVIIEKEETPGGLCRSVHQDGFTFDYTGHLLHISDARIHEFVEEMLGFEHLYYHERKAFIYSHGRLGAYPFQSNLYGLPTDVVVQCIEGFLRRKRRTGVSFRSWVLQHFGVGLAEHFFFPYQEKIFCYPVQKLSASWTGRFVPQTTLAQLIEGVIAPRVKQDVGYNAHFYYPRVGGIQPLIEEIYKRLANQVLTNQLVKHIDTINNVIHLDCGGSVHYRTLINTMPLQALCCTIIDKSTTQFYRAARMLRASSVLNVNVGVYDQRWPDQHWVYAPEKQYAFYRVGFPHLLSEHMAPKGCSSLSLECAYVGQPPAMMVECALRDCKRMFDLVDSDIATIKVLNLACAYTTYNRWRDTNVPSLLNALRKNNIYSVGRYGAWYYASMQEAMIDGIVTAQELLRDRGHVVHDSTIRSEKGVHV